MTGIHTIISLGAGDSLVAVLGGLVSTTQPEFISSWVDTTTPNVPGRNFGAFNNTTEIELVAAPSSEWRQVDGLTVYNGDTAAAEVTIQIANGATRRTLAVLSLAVGETWFPLVQRFGAKGDAGADGAPGDPGPPGDAGDGDGDDSWWVGAGAAASAQAASQPLNTLLTAIAALATTGLMAVTGAGTTSLRTITGTTNQVNVTNGDGVAGNPTLSLPQDIHTGATPTFAAVTATTFTGALSGNATTATTATNAVNSAITDDTSTNATMYPVWVTAATGNLPLKVSSTDLTWNPSTNTFALTGGPFTNTQAVAATSTDGLVLATSATATVGAQKWSPRVRFLGSGWGTTGSAAQTVEFTTEVKSVQGTTPTGLYVISSSINGVAFAPKLSLNTGNPTLFIGDTNAVFLDRAATSILDIGVSGTVATIRTSSTITNIKAAIGIFSTSQASPDVFLTREGAASLIFGQAAANPAVAQTLSVQGASGSNIAGAAWTFTESYATGTAKGGGYQWRIGLTLGTGTTSQSTSTMIAMDLGVTTYKTLTFGEAINIATGTTTGTIIGTTTTQKIGFYGATPIVQGASVADATDAASAITQLNALISRIEALGLIATV